MSKKLALIAEARKRKQNQKEMSDSLLSIVRSAVEENIVHGRDGKDGERGERGPQGEMGLQGPEGPAGRDGKDGVNGLTEIIHKYEPLPDDVVKEEFLEELRKEVEGLKKNQRFIGTGGGASDGIKYVSVTSPVYKISRNELLNNGITIYGVNYAGAVTITMPQPKPGQIVYINDESGNADSNNITVTTLQS